jgi:hypothetical protein
MLINYRRAVWDSFTHYGGACDIHRVVIRAFVVLAKIFFIVNYAVVLTNGVRYFVYRHHVSCHTEKRFFFTFNAFILTQKKLFTFLASGHLLRTLMCSNFNLLCLKYGLAR